MSRNRRRNRACDPVLRTGADGSGEGPSVGNELPLLVLRDGVPSPPRGRGITDRRAIANTARAPQEAPPATRLTEPRVPTTSAGKTRQRMKWTKELNVELMRTYYFATNLETEPEGYRKKLFEEWKKLYPESTLTEQNLCGQVRSIQTGQRLSEAELTNIKQQIRDQLQPVENVQVERLSLETTPPANLTPHAEGDIANSDIRGLPGQQGASTSLPEEGDDSDPTLSLTSLTDAFNRFILIYGGMTAKFLPRIPKPSINPKVTRLLKKVDGILDDYLDRNQTFEHLLLAVHCAAYSVCEAMGCKIDIVGNSPQHRQGAPKKPHWVKRIEKRINII